MVLGSHFIKIIETHQNFSLIPMAQYARKMPHHYIRVS
jgi:hypothetical protein